MPEIYGMGHDLLENAQLESALSKPKAMKRIFTSEEIEHCRGQKADKLACFARRFAVKEAVIKALGYPCGQLSEISVKRGDEGAPIVEWGRLSERGLRAIVSASSSGAYSSATAILVALVPTDERSGRDGEPQTG